MIRSGEFCNQHDICLHRRRSWCVSTGREFGPKAADIVGLCLNQSEKELVLCVDESHRSGQWTERKAGCASPTAGR